MGNLHTKFHTLALDLCKSDVQICEIVCANLVQNLEKATPALDLCKFHVQIQQITCANFVQMTMYVTSTRQVVAQAIEILEETLCPA